MKRLYISQPMRGKTTNEIRTEREEAIKIATEKLGESVIVVDSFFEEAPAENKPLWYLGKALQLLATADVAYFCKGWNEARGCKIEETCAAEYGIARLYAD